MIPAYLHALIGGAPIGLSAAIYLLLDGRVAGVSGIIGGALRRVDENQLRNASFLLGLFLGPNVYRMSIGAWPVVHYEGSIWILAIAGVLVGYGTRLGSGCTSGHGVLRACAAFAKIDGCSRDISCGRDDYRRGDASLGILTSP